jgi:nitroimidazol reductase NimA-like FMN-containing flavoprotein (pyridoxamine 5'-phosphate oxidase superfamily)
MLGNLNDIQINNILSSQVLGKMACTDGLQPYIVPVTYAYDGKHIYGQTNEGTKLEILRKNRNVCFAVDIMLNMRNWQSVLVFGEFEELDTEQANSARELLFNRIFPLTTSSTVQHEGHEETYIPEDVTRIKNIMYRINITKTTGRFEKE